MSNLSNLFNTYQLIDLTHPLNPDVPSWGGDCGFQLHTTQDYAQGCRVQQFTMHGGIGTHMDAPAHFIPGAAAIADIPLQQLMIPAHVLHIATTAPADYLITPDDILAYEKTFGRVTKNSLLIADTGWGRYWNDTKQYRNQDENGVMHFPAFSKDSADLLIARDIAGIGIDTLSPDSTDSTFSVHHSVLGAGKYIVENLANVHLLPAVGSYVFILPIKVVDATEAPLRAVALIPT